MMPTRYFFIEPLDVLMLRGNRSFGDSGEHGETLMPPWPSVFAGALRSALLGNDARRLAEFVKVGSSAFSSETERALQMRSVLGDALFNVLGTPQQPGTFRVTWASLGRVAPGAQTPQALLPLPADLLVADARDALPMALTPTPWPPGTSGAQSLPMVALLRSAKQVKPAGGRCLDGNALAAHLRGAPVASTESTALLYTSATRLGIALDAKTRTARDHALYTTDAVAFCQDTGFIVGVQGDSGLLPMHGLLRLGGDAKGARYRDLPFDAPGPALPRQGERFRLILTTPGLFAHGWLPGGVVADDAGDTHAKAATLRLRGPGFGARLACAAIGRHEVVSGWDLAQWQPKTAQRAVPAGSVYWFDEFEGDAGKLASWVAHGLSGENESTTPAQQQRRAEGFNNALLGAWT